MTSHQTALCTYALVSAVANGGHEVRADKASARAVVDTVGLAPRGLQKQKRCRYKNSTEKVRVRWCEIEGGNGRHTFMVTYLSAWWRLKSLLRFLTIWLGLIKGLTICTAGGGEGRRVSVRELDSSSTHTHTDTQTLKGTKKRACALVRRFDWRMRCV
jgi:hypothetical protein